MSYTENYTLRTCDCDAFGRWKPSVIMEMMQETAIAHCDSIGLGRAVTDALGVVWVISRCRVELDRLPAIGDRFSIETFPMAQKHLFWPRGYVFRDAGGTVFGGANTLWMLMEVKSRRATGNQDVARRLPDEGPVAVRMPQTVRACGDDAVTGMIEPQFTEFDINGHVNNTKYLDWCWNALGFDTLSQRTFSGFDVNYEREVRRGEVITTALSVDENKAVFCGYEGAQRCFAISVDWRA